MESNNFRNIPSRLELNGPILTLTQQPSNYGAVDNGSATFTALAIASFPSQTPPNPATNTGTIAYRWYEVGVGALSDNSNISGSNTSTLSLTNLSYANNNDRQFYVQVDYVPSIYTANAINEPLISDTVTLTVYPSIVITSQPSSVTVAQTRTAYFSFTATPSDGTLSYQWQLNNNNLSDGSTVSGSRTTSLAISSSNVFNNSIRALISHPTAGNSPIYTNSVNFNVVSARKIINVEYANEGGSGGADAFATVNLFDSSYTLAAGDYPSRLTCFYAVEQDLEVIMEIYGQKGSDGSGYRGGEGGVSVIRTTLRRNEEYIITSLPQATGTGGVFIYRKSRLIICVGGGGSAGNGGNGGNGGGVNVSGASGSGRGAGNGGSVYSPGSLPSDGVFGSIATGLTGLYPGDSTAPYPLGGRIIPCPKGYWYGRGYSACQDVGVQQLWRANGNLVTNSAYIDRGFKSGYGIRNTAGGGLSGGGNGGAGATGGNGGNGGGGGGGGSGYYDGSVQVLSTQQGGNYGTARVIIRSAD
jgi:hypothetical protein